ncbi:MAG: glycosyltransferase family 2 protein [Cyclobacteriaceae bacterium]
MELVFWSLISVVIYTYIGYGVLIFVLVKLKRVNNPPFIKDQLPSIVHLIAAYNEEKDIRKKIENSLDLNYPENKHEVWVVTDGSSDRTPEIVSEYKKVRLFHQDKREGKIHAVNRVMPLIHSKVTVFSDANTLLNREALKLLAGHYQNKEVGGVSGEKRIAMEKSDDASSSGEGIYWKYESFLKKYDYKLYSVVGAAGELFSIRTDLYEHIPKDTLIEDFYLTLIIAKKGFRIAYEPNAFATEKSSASVKEESKRKIRISAGGLQAIWRLRDLLNIVKYGWLSFQFVSHRVLRWTLAPLALPAIFIVNLILALNGQVFYQVLFFLQIACYLLAFLGWMLQKQKLKLKIFFVPYYFVFMNISVYLGFIRLITGKQSVTWERAERKG